MVLQDQGEQHEALRELEAPSEEKVSTEAGGLVWGLLTGKLGWDVVHKEQGAGQGLGAAGWNQGFVGLGWDRTGSGCRHWRGHWEQWWCSVLAWQVEMGP